jgi:tRNA pseudouridine55 synthase
MVQYDGILLCNKPFGITSHDLINNLKHIIEQRRIGHTGTLDPRATGLMIICLGRATKIAQFLSGVDKTYSAEIKLGFRSLTFDSEGITDKMESNPVPHVTMDDMKSLLSEFKGVIKQKVPAFSAVKVEGQRLYKLARVGKQIELPEREVEIKELEITKFEPPIIEFTVSCSKGTYIRTLANDIGERIGCGAYLSHLNRTKVGNYQLKDALSINEIKYYRQAGTLKRYLKPIESVLPFPAIKVSENFSPGIISGKSPRTKDIIDIHGEFSPNDFISLVDYTGRIMAVGKAGIKSSDLNEIQGKDFFTYVRVLN